VAYHVIRTSHCSFRHIESNDRLALCWGQALRVVVLTEVKVLAFFHNDSIPARQGLHTTAVNGMRYGVTSRYGRCPNRWVH
jgi:hypothetical protein